MESKTSDTGRKEEKKSIITSTDITQELLKFNVATKEEIEYALNNVINNNDINEVMDFILMKKEKKINAPPNQNKSVCINYTKYSV